MNGVGHGVLPLGLRQSERWDNVHERLPVTMYEIHEHFRVAATMPDPGREVLRLLQLYPVPDLCSAHGLPPAHAEVVNDEGRTVGCPMDLIDGSRALRVDHLIAMISGLDGVRTLAKWMTAQRMPPSRRMVENALLWPVLRAGFRRQLLAELERDSAAVPVDAESRSQQRELAVLRGRQIVTSTLTTAMKQSQLTTAFEWNHYHRPEVVLRAFTGTAAYVADFATHVIDSPTQDQDATATCANCGVPFRPRRRSGSAEVFCDEIECRRARKRRSQAARRAQLREGENT